MEQIEAEAINAESVSMELSVDYKPLSITSNIEELRTYVQSAIEPFKGVTLELDNKKAISEAKNTYAGLNKLGAAIDTRRKEVVRELNAPVTKLDNDLKEIVSEIKTAYREGKNQLDAIAEAQQKARRDELKEDYYGIVGGEIAALIPFDKIENPSWKTPSYGEKKASDELFEAASKIVMEVKTLGEMEFTHKAEVLACYNNTLDLTKALAEDKRIETEKAEAQKVAEQTERAFHLPTSQEEPTAVVEVPETKNKESFALILRDVHITDAQKIARYAQEITGKKPELKNSSWLESVM